jgi:predicted dehydrogenase
MAKKLKVGVIGAGGIAQFAHLPGYASIPDECEVVAICDINPETAKTAAEKFGIPKVVTDYREMVSDREIGAVSVTTPNALHMQPTVAALRAGKHVLCEKPLGINAKECRQMCRAAKESGKILQVGLQFRFSGTAQFMRTYIDAGHMGDIYYARAQALRRRGVPAWGAFIDKEKQGGGPLIDIGVHVLDLTLFLMGYPKPVVASGKTWNQLGTDPALYNAWGDYDRSRFSVEDFAAGFIKFEDDSVVVLDSSFMGNLEDGPIQTQLFGTKSGALIKASGDDPIKIFTEHDKQVFDMIPRNIPKVESPHIEEVRAFVQAIRHRKASPVPGEQGLTLNAIFDALYKSSETGKEQRVDVTF